MDDKILNLVKTENKKAFTELLKMMQRKELITVSYFIDENGYESVYLASPHIAKFPLRFSDGIFSFIYRYLEFGEVDESLVAPELRLIHSDFDNSNDFATNVLKRIISYGIDMPYVYIIPEIVDKPNRLTVTFRYPHGIVVFKVNRTEEIMSFLSLKGY